MIVHSCAKKCTKPDRRSARVIEQRFIVTWRGSLLPKLLFQYDTDSVKSLLLTSVLVLPYQDLHKIYSILLGFIYGYVHLEKRKNF